MRYVGDIENSQTRFPVCPVDVGPAEARVILFLSRPSLDGHVMDVDPASKGGLPTDFGLAHLDYSRQVTIASEVQMSESDPPAGITLSHIARLVVGVGDEDVPLVVNHVSVEIVRTARVVDIVPRVDPTGVGLVCDID